MSNQWIERVRAASAGKELLEFLTRRLLLPYEEGPGLDDRNCEGVEDVIIDAARDSEAFRDRLDETIAGYFRSGASAPLNTPSSTAVIRGLLRIVGVLSLAGCASPVRAWLVRHDMIQTGYVGTTMNQDEWVRTRDVRDALGMRMGVGAWLALGAVECDRLVREEYAKLTQGK